MDKPLLLQFQHLIDWFKRQKHVAVTFSGGVDSALLLYVGTQVLGLKNCQGLFADSCLISSQARESALHFAQEHHLALQRIQVNPLGYAGFTENRQNRCYICKKNTYLSFIKIISSITILVDGTNVDDLDKDRPGYQALCELDVATPFLHCKMSKFAIRSLSYHLGLDTWDKLSDSCLATRIKPDSVINKAELFRIAEIEQGLHLLGLDGCRVKIRNEQLFLTVHSGQLKQTLNNYILKYLDNIRKRYEFTKIFLDLFEREGILPSLLDYIGFKGKITPSKQLLDHFNNMSG